MRARGQESRRDLSKFRQLGEKVGRIPEGSGCFFRRYARDGRAVTRVLKNEGHAAGLAWANLWRRRAARRASRSTYADPHVTGTIVRRATESASWLAESQRVTRLLPCSCGAAKAGGDRLGRAEGQVEVDEREVVPLDGDEGESWQGAS